MRVLISGAGGFVGSHLAAAMARDGHDVVALVRRTAAGLLAGYENVRIEQADIADPAQALPVGPFDALIHCAAAIPSAVPDEAELIRINVEGARRLFAHTIEAGAGVIVFCSSMAVYGRIAVDIVDPDTPIETPGSYGRSKLQCEALLADLSRADDSLRALSIRLPGVVGRGSHHNFLSDTIERLGGGEPVPVRNPDALFNNVVHVDDLAGFIGSLLGDLSPGHRVTTIAAVEPLRVRDVVDILRNAVGRAGDVLFRHEGHSFLVSSDCACRLGYKPATVRNAVERFAVGYAADLQARALPSP